MKREQLEHVLRASAAIAQEQSFVVIGSQAVLLPFPDAPMELLLSNEVDLYPALHPERADLIDGSIGVLSPFTTPSATTPTVRHHMIDAATLKTRVRALDPAQRPIDKLLAWVDRRAAEAA